MHATATDWLLISVATFCFGYPFVMAWYWMAGAMMFYITRERHMAPPDRPPPIEHPPPISVLVLEKSSTSAPAQAGKHSLGLN